ncbi:MAG: hypothetical protein AVDCRST_MAG06-452, partial [uncultured Nocardioides sp.]
EPARRGRPGPGAGATGSRDGARPDDRARQPARPRGRRPRRLRWRRGRRRRPGPGPGPGCPGRAGARRARGHPPGHARSRVGAVVAAASHRDPPRPARQPARRLDRGTLAGPSYGARPARRRPAAGPDAVADRPDDAASSPSPGDDHARPGRWWAGTPRARPRPGRPVTVAAHLLAARRPDHRVVRDVRRGARRPGPGARPHQPRRERRVGGARGRRRGPRARCAQGVEHPAHRHPRRPRRPHPDLRPRGVRRPRPPLRWSHRGRARSPGAPAAAAPGL